MLCAGRTVGLLHSLSGARCSQWRSARRAVLRWHLLAPSLKPAPRTACRFTKMKRDLFGEEDAFYNQDKPKFRFRREGAGSA